MRNVDAPRRDAPARRARLMDKIGTIPMEPRSRAVERKTLPGIERRARANLVNARTAALESDEVAAVFFALRFAAS